MRSARYAASERASLSSPASPGHYPHNSIRRPCTRNCVEPSLQMRAKFHNHCARSRLRWRACMILFAPPQQSRAPDWNPRRPVQPDHRPVSPAYPQTRVLGRSHPVLHPEQPHSWRGFPQSGRRAGLNPQWLPCGVLRQPFPLEDEAHESCRRGARYKRGCGCQPLGLPGPCPRHGGPGCHHQPRPPT